MRTEDLSDLFLDTRDSREKYLYLGHCGTTIYVLKRKNKTECEDNKLTILEIEWHSEEDVRDLVESSIDRKEEWQNEVASWGTEEWYSEWTSNADWSDYMEDFMIEYDYLHDRNWKNEIDSWYWETYYEQQLEISKKIEADYSDFLDVINCCESIADLDNRIELCEDFYIGNKEYVYVA